MRSVLDCNAVIGAALSPSGITASAVKKAEQLHTLLASRETLEELSETIFKKKFDRYFSPIDARIEIINRYTKIIEWIVPSHKVSACRDPKDNKCLELALSGKANCIITGDPDLLVLNPFENISILLPKEFLEKF